MSAQILFLVEDTNCVRKEKIPISSLLPPRPKSTRPEATPTSQDQVNRRSPNPRIHYYILSIPPFQCVSSNQNSESHQQVPPKPLSIPSRAETNTTMSSSLQILRPKPRRPYERNNDSRQPPSPLLSPADAASGTSETPSRTRSILNLTSSTLLGIYSPTADNDRYDLNEPSTPWGTGAETPSITYNPPSSPLSLSQLSPRLRRKSVAPQYTPQPKNNTLGDALNLGFRSVLLFGMGMGYGLLVRHLHDDRQLAPFQVEGIIKLRNDWRYLVFWGIAGVALGSLLPWVDTLFRSDVGVENEPIGEGTGSGGEDEKELDSNGIYDADWTPVVRSVGAFVGIAFAIVCLPLLLSSMSCY